MNPDNVSIIIPAYNEEEAIGFVVEGLIAAFPTSEIIVVDDCSTDNTRKLAEEAGARVISHARNSGYGAGLRTGTEAADREYVLFCDADGQHTIEDVEKIIDSIGDEDMVVGARGQDSHVQLSRRPGKFVLKRFANYLAGENIPDLNSGLRAIRRDLLLKYMHLMPSGFSFSTTSTFAMLKTNRRILWIPITVKKRLGTSSVRQLRHGSQTIMLMLRLTVLFEPLKVFLSVAGWLFLLSILTLGVNLYISGGQQIGLTTVVFFLAALMVFMFGLLCDQVSALRREIHE